MLTGTNSPALLKLQELKNIWVTHGREGCAGALVRDNRKKAEPLSIQGRDEELGDMKRFSQPLNYTYFEKLSQ